MGFVIQKLFYSAPNPFCIFLAEIKLMQKLLLPFLLLAVTIAFGQSKYMTKSGSMSFEASQPSFEPIEATHSAVSALLNADTGELAVLALVRGFRFPLALMDCLLYTSPSPRDRSLSRMPSSA